MRSPSSRAAAGALALLAFGQLIGALDYNIVYVALPEIGSGLGFSAQSLQWVVSAYAVAFGGLLLFGGRAADVLGRRRMFVTAMALYGTSSLVGGLTDDGAVLVAARAVQGAGGALLIPATLSLIYGLFAEGPARNRALAVWGGAGAVGLAAGSFLGGVLTHAFGWSAVFLVNVPLTAVAVVAAFAVLPPDGPRDRTQPLDVVGALTATVGVTSVVLALVQGPESGWTSPLVVACLVLGAVLLAGFLGHEARTRVPLLPLRLLGNRNLTVAMAVTFVFMGTFGTQYYLFTVYLQEVRGYTSWETGLAFLPAALVGMVGSRVAAAMLNRWGTKPTLATALITGGAGMAVFAAAVSDDGGFAVLLPGIVLIALGQGVGWTSMFAAAGTGVQPAEQGIASAMASTTQQIGSAVGLAALVAVVNAQTELVGGLRTAGFVAAAATVLAAGVTRDLGRRAVAPERETVDA